MTWSSQVDDVARLLAAEDAALASQRLEHVAVADVGRDDADAALLHQPVEAEVRHRRDRDEVDTEVEREHRDDLVAVERLRRARRPRASGRRRRRRRCPRSKPPVDDERAAARARSVAPQPTLMFVPSGSSPIASTSAPSCSNASGAMPAYAPFAQSTAMRRPVEVGAEALEHVLEVAVDGDVDAVDLAAARRGRVEQRLDLLLRRVGELAALAVEELDAVVLRRVVRRRDDDAEVEARAARPPASAGRRRAPRRRRRRRRRARTPPRAPRPSARVSRPTKTRPPPDQSVDALPSRSTSSAVRNSPTTPRTPSVPKYCLAIRVVATGRSGRKGARQRFENCGALRALCRPAFLRSTWRASRVR